MNCNTLLHKWKWILIPQGHDFVHYSFLLVKILKLEIAFIDSYICGSFKYTSIKFLHDNKSRWLCPCVISIQELLIYFFKDYALNQITYEYNGLYKSHALNY